jgi:hypothetical protein
MLKYAKVIKSSHGDYRVECNDRPLYVFASFLAYKALEHNYEFLTNWLQGKYRQNYINDGMFILIRQDDDQIIVFFECDVDSDDGEDYARISHFKKSTSFFIQAINDFIKCKNIYPHVDDILIAQQLDHISIAQLEIEQNPGLAL